MTEAVFNASAESTLADIPSGDVSATFKTAMKSQPQWGKAWENYTWPSGKVQNTSVCILSFEIPNDIQPPILFYYRLTNFYQNHRRYVKSVDIEQLKGTARSVSDIDSGDCGPLDSVNGKPYYPCGLIANSMFNDTFTNLTATNPSQNENSPSVYNMTTGGISWAHEGDLYGKTKYSPADVVPPPNWQEQYIDGRYNELPDLHTWEAFQVWMRTAGLPTFSKLAQRNDNDVLRAGTYRLKIYDRKSARRACQSATLLSSHVFRLSGTGIQWHKVHLDLHTHRYGWQKSVFGHRVHRCRWPLHPARCCVPCHSSHQAEVSCSAPERKQF